MKDVTKEQVFDFIRNRLKFEEGTKFEDVKNYCRDIRLKDDEVVNTDGMSEIETLVVKLRGGENRRPPTEIGERDHKRFEMSGYEGEVKGKCTLHNLAIVNLFADLGIYDYTDYLILDFYKGIGTIYYRYFQTQYNQELELGGYGTTEIIYEIFKLTILTDKRTRRRY